MRMFNVDPKNMCNQHLLGAHQECHVMAAMVLKGGTLHRGSLSGLARTGKMAVHLIVEEHSQLEYEMTRRGMKPVAVFPDIEELLWEEGQVNRNESLVTLYIRCEGCRERIGSVNFEASLSRLTSDVVDRIIRDEMNRRAEGRRHALLALLRREGVA